MDKRIVFAGGACFSIGIILLLHSWRLAFSSGCAIWIWFELLGLLISTIGLVIFFHGATADLVKPEWLYQETPRYQKLLVKVLGYLGLALLWGAVLFVIVAHALWLLHGLGYI